MSYNLNQRIEGALEQVTLSLDAKYRIKNKMTALPLKHNKHTGRKLSSAAVIAVTLVSLLVITAAAIGGLSYFKAIYGDKAETLSPYGVTISTSAQNNDVVVTLQESVADEYATAYIFSIKGLTDTGKTLLINNTLDPDAYQTAFEQTNCAKSVWPDNRFHDEQGNYIKPTVIPPEITGCKIYSLHQKTSSGDFMDFNIGLRYDGVTYNAIDNTTYTIIPIESLREENCEYYALYVITPETHQLTLTFDGLEILLPEATTRIPGTEVTFNGYIQDYFLTEGGMSRIMDDYPTSAVLTPLGLYVNDTHTRSLMYKYATLVFNDGSEHYLSEISNDKSGIASWKPRYLPTYYQGVVYLFNEIMDVSTVKSLVFSDEIEFPFDGNAPFARSSGRILDPNNPQLLWWKTAVQIRDYIIETCPDTQSVRKTGWSVSNKDQSYNFKIINNGSVNDNSSEFNIIFSELSGGTLEEEARATVDEMNVNRRARGFENDLTFNVTGKGTYNGTDVIVVECGQSQPGFYKRCIFAIYEGKLLTFEYNGYTGQPTDFAFDALLDLITF